MTVPDPTTDDVTALGEVLDRSPLRCPHGSPDFCGVCIAEHVLASSWLAERDARIKAEAAAAAAEALRAVAEDFEIEGFESVATELRERADVWERGESL